MLYVYFLGKETVAQGTCSVRTGVQLEPRGCLLAGHFLYSTVFLFKLVFHKGHCL